MVAGRCCTRRPLIFPLVWFAGSGLRFLDPFTVVVTLEVPMFSSVMNIAPDTGFFICFLSALVAHVVTEVVAEEVAWGGGRNSLVLGFGKVEGMAHGGLRASTNWECRYISPQKRMFTYRDQAYLYTQFFSSTD